MNKPTRKERIPVNSTRDILTVANKDPNYEYRWVLDVPGRIVKFQDGGWEVVTEDLKVGDKAVDSNTKVGSAITKRTGVSMLVLMRIPKEWYDEDQAAKQAGVDATEEMLQADIAAGKFPGAGSTERGSYVPTGGGLTIRRR